MGILLEHIEKSFGDPPVRVLKDISLEIKDGEMVTLTGRSGSGKSTLLYVISTLDRPNSGRVAIDGQEVSAMSGQEVHHFRNENMGFVFQFHYLLPELSALENVLMPTLKTNTGIQRAGLAKELLAEFGLKDKFDRLPSQLSGGEQQRVAIARALVMKPRYVFADEPTGNLDSVSGGVVMNLLKRINSEFKTTIIYVTHDADYAAMAPRQIHLVDGARVSI